MAECCWLFNEWRERWVIPVHSVRWCQQQGRSERRAFPAFLSSDLERRWSREASDSVIISIKKECREHTAVIGHQWQDLSLVMDMTHLSAKLSLTWALLEVKDDGSPICILFFFYLTFFIVVFALSRWSGTIPQCLWGMPIYVETHWMTNNKISKIPNYYPIPDAFLISTCNNFLQILVYCPFLNIF